MRRRISCGLDPGRDKFGFAITDGDMLVYSAIVPIARIDDAIALLASGKWGALSLWGQEKIISPAELDDIGSRVKDYVIYLGDGTGSDIFQQKMREAGLRYSVTSETNTTLDGRALYWQLHPPRGLLRLVPTSLRVPPRPIDDMAAWAIIERARGSFFNA